MYLHHTPTAIDGTMPASSIVRADICVVGPALTALTTFKKRDVQVGDDIQHMKVLYKVKTVKQYRNQTQIIAHEA